MKRTSFRLLLLISALCVHAGLAHAQSYQISPGPSSGPVALTDGIQGRSYFTSFSTNGNGPTNWSVSAGLAPPGLTLATTSNTTVGLSGTPTATGTFTFTLQASESVSLVATQDYTIVVIPALTITTPLTLPDATAGANYTRNFTAVNGTLPLNWSWNSDVGGSLPPGMTISSSGVLSGAPTQAGTFSFDVLVTDSSSTQVQFDDKTFTITVNPPPSVATATTLPGGVVGTPYTTTLVVTGGTPSYFWFIASGPLPPGITLSSGGTLSGTPTTVGNYVFTATVADAYGASSTGSFLIAIDAAFAITTASPLPNGSVSVPYSLQLSATGGKSPFIWQVIAGALPGGLTLNRFTGVLNGIPSATGAFQFTIRLTDSTEATTSRLFDLTITSKLQITTASLPDGKVGTSYSQQIAVTGGTAPYTYSLIGTLPTGLTLNATNGSITGTPTQAGTSNFSVKVADAGNATVTKNLSITIAAAGPPLAFTTASPLPNATSGAAYTQALVVTGGTPPYSFVIDSGALPAGITLDSGGTLSGTPTTAGTSTFTVRVSDASESTLTKPYSLTVTPPAVPAPTITGVNDTEPPAQQPAVAVQLATAYTLPLDGTMTLDFAPESNGPDDPAIQFSTGGRSAIFTIASGATDATFAGANFSLATGTVAGTITLTLHLEAGGVDVTPSPAPTRVIQIPAQAPVFTVAARRTGSGIAVDMTGFSNTRDMTTAVFQFQASSGTSLQTPSVTIQAGSLFTPWYANPDSLQFGSQYTYTQEFNISGNAAGVTSVSVTLTNGQGASSAVSATIQ